MSPTLANLYRIFGGDTVLLPIPKGKKGPKIQQWQTITLAESLLPMHQNRLELCITRGGNIGVLLGPASGYLMSIDIDRDHLISDFLALNPILAATTRTHGKRGCNFFVRIKPGVPYPNSKAEIRSARFQRDRMWGMALWRRRQRRADCRLRPPS